MFRILALLYGIWFHFQESQFVHVPPGRTSRTTVWDSLF